MNRIMVCQIHYMIIQMLNLQQCARSKQLSTVVNADSVVYLEYLVSDLAKEKNHLPCTEIIIIRLNEYTKGAKTSIQINYIPVITTSK